VSYFAAGLIMLGVIVVALYWIAYASPKTVRAGLLLSFGIMFVVVALLAFATGKYVLSFPSLLGAWVAYRRYLAVKGIWSRFGSGGPQGTAGGPAASSAQGPSSRGEACDILGVATDASDEEIIRAHKELMQKFHPDRGGSSHIASQINAAKDFLLGD
jgi:DnaJ domain